MSRHPVAAETIYKDAGLRGKLRAYEWFGLYSSISALSQLFDDPVSLYLWGDVLLVGARLLAVFLSLSVISRSPLPRW